MAITNLQVVQRSWGLFELATRNPRLVLGSTSRQPGGEHEDTAELSYGSQFKYEEFLALPSRLHALFLVLLLVIVAGAMRLFPPVGVVIHTFSNYPLILAFFRFGGSLVGSCHGQEMVPLMSMCPHRWKGWCGLIEVDYLAFRQLEAGALYITNITTSLPNAQGRTTTVRTIFRGKGEPGYLLSSGRYSLYQFPPRGSYEIDQ